MRKIFRKLSGVVSIFLCLALLLNTVAFAADSQPNAVVESISIYNRSGILEGETIQLKADVEASSSAFDSVEWSSSDPSVISCTEDGKIKGLVAGKSATITCKAKWGSKKASIGVYCVERLPEEVKSGFEKKIAFIYQGPNARIKDISLDLRYFFSPFNIMFEIFAEFFARISSNVITDNKVSVVGKFKNYAYIRYGENKSEDGFVRYTALKNKVDGFLTLSATQISLWADGNDYSTGILTSDYNGNIKWDVDDKEYASYNDKTGQITGEIPGKVVTVTATADGMTAECKVRLLYKWPQTWVGKANKDTHLYKMNGTGFKEKRSLKSGSDFTVYGDCGTNDGWVFGCYKIGETNNWGYVPISDISTKGTISQYNNLETTSENGEKVPWVWPMYDESIKNISSPYGPRNITSYGTIHHRGFDITTGNPGDIAGEYVVATASGIVTKRFKNTTDCGYCVCISTECIDPITNKNISIIYMHLLELPKYKNGKEVLVGDYITVGTIIGKVGKTNGNTDPDMGYHLHFEANSQNAAVKDPGRSDFTYTLNPMYFFVEKNVTFSGTNSYKKYGGYWYDLNGGYQNEEIFKSYFNF